MTTVLLRHGHATTGGSGPGQVDIPADEAQALVDAGYASWLMPGPPLVPEPEAPPGAGPEPLHVSKPEPEPVTAEKSSQARRPALKRKGAA